MKNRPVEAQLLHAVIRTDGRTDRQTDMTKLIVALRNLSNARKSRLKFAEEQ